MSPQKETIQKMNQLAKAKTPFLFLTDFEANQSKVFTAKDLEQENIFFQFPNNTNINSDHAKLKTKIQISSAPSQSQYEEAYQKVLTEIKHGNSYLTNLTFPIEINSEYTLKDLFDSADALYKIFYKDQFICFSPETFVKIQNGKIATYPMKGTFTAKQLDDPTEILKDKKEAAEHATVVDLLRNDLSQVASQVRVTNYRYISKIISSEDDEHYQISSEISGKLDPNYINNLGEIIFSLLPAGSVSGAPKIKTMSIIKEAEDYSRGFYTGIAGFFDGESFDSCVLIRFIEKIDNKLYFKSGGGITALSDLDKEYQELLNKVYVPVHREY